MSLMVTLLNSFNVFGLNLILILILTTKCVKNQCSDVRIPIGGAAKVECVNTPRIQCVFSCKQGCIEVPPLTFTCENNIWNPRDPTPNSMCRPPDCPQISILNGNTCGQTPVGTTCTFNCNSGYQISGKTTLQCVSESAQPCVSNWEGTPSPVLPVCTQMGCSSDLVRPANGYLDRNCPRMAPINQQCSIFCDPGFTVVSSNPTVVCTSSGWSPPNSQLSICQQIRCPDLTERNNLIFINSNQCRGAVQGTRCQLNCPSGYYLSPNINYLECNSNGQWSAQLPTCIRFCDPDIFRPTNGFTEGFCQSPVVGQECIVGCNSGFFLSPNTPRIECTSNGWSPSLVPVCQQIRCPDLIETNDLIFSDNNQCRNALPGSRCQFSCRSGYYASPNINYLDCNSIGQWSGQLPTCVRTCYPDILQPTNGIINGNCQSPVVGQECIVGCNSGFILSPYTPRIECTSNGWNPSLVPVCQQIRCPDLIETNDLIFSDNNQCRNALPGSRCEFNCQAGYHTSPNINYLDCNSIGQWSEQLPTCVRTISCPDIIDSFGSATQGVCTNALVDDVCTWTCNPGYHNPLTNNQQMTARCQANGEWDGPTRCVQVTCPSLERPVDGTYTDATCNPGIAGSSCQFTCFDRFTLDPPDLSRILCQDDGTWSNGGNVPRCVSTPDCTDVPDMLFAKKDGHCVTTPENELRLESVCNIICYQGCFLDGGFSGMVLNCVEINGIRQWDKQIPRECLQQTQCQPFGPIIDGSACNSANIGDTCTLACNAGFRLVGDDVLTCILPSTPIPETCPIPQWSIPRESDQLPVCQRIVCGELTAPQNGQLVTPVTCASALPEQVCVFSCDVNFFIDPVGRQELTCQADGTWTEGGEPPVCLPILCQDISGTVIENGGLNVDDSCTARRVGDVCTFFCNENYVINGQTSTECESDGVWSNAIPTCGVAIIECVALPDIDNGIKEGTCNPGRSGETCTYVCNEGFALSADPEFLCNPDRTWDKGDIPTCTEIFCEAIEIDNAEGGCAESKSGDKCTVTCNDGESFELTCDGTGEWDEIPICKQLVQCEGLTPPPSVKMAGTCNPGLPEQKCTLSCNTSPSRMKTIVCKSDGQWSDSIDTFKCGGPPSCPAVRLPNGAKSIKFCSPGKLGKRCEMGCGKGFKMDGKNSLLCTMNGKWIGKTARCLRQCRPIRALNGRVSGQCKPSGVQNRYCSLRCNGGFALVGPRTALCGANGLWTPTVPRCMRKLSNCG